MNIFEIVRANITAHDAAKYYGIKVNRRGMACCPFHADKHPSMKLDQRFHCFGCQADGDAVDFTAGLFGIGKYEAAQKLLDDFGIAYEKNSNKNRKKKTRKQPLKDKQMESEFRLKKLKKQMDTWFTYAKETLLKYDHLLKYWKEQYAPKTAEENWHPLFEEALQMQTLISYHLDILFFGSDDERLDFFVMRERG